MATTVFEKPVGTETVTLSNRIDTLNSRFTYVTSGSLHDIKTPGVYSIAGAVADKPTNNGGTYIVSSYSNGSLVGGTYIDVVTGDAYSVNLYSGTWTYTKLATNDQIGTLNSNIEQFLNTRNLPSNISSFNDLTTPGRYGLYNTSLNNAPASGLYGYVDVIKYAVNFIAQNIWSYTSNGFTVYSRRRNENSVWSSWTTK